jgi:MFS family permease
MDQQTVLTKQTKIWNRQFVNIFISNALMNLGQWMVQPMITKYARDLGATSAVLGFVAGAFAITAILFKLISGPAIDTFNRRNVLIIALIVMGLSFLGFSISTIVPMVIAFRLLQGAGLAFTATCCLALATDALPPDKIGTGIGTFTLAQAISQAIAPTVGLTVADHFGFNAAFLLAAIFMVLAALMAFSVKTMKPSSKKEFKISLNNTISIPSLLPAFLIFLLTSCFCLINSYLVIFATDRGIENIGYYFTMYAITLLITRPLFGRLSDKYGFRRVVIPAMFLFAVSYYVISISKSLPVFLLAAFISAFGYGASQPLINSLCMKTVLPEHRGAASVTSYIGTDLGSIVGPVIAGVIAGRFGYAVMWRAMTVMIFIALMFVIIFKTKIQNIEENFRRQNLY